MRRRTWSHDRVLSTEAPAGEREEGDKGDKEKEKGMRWRLRWGRAVSGTSTGCAGGRALKRVGGPNAGMGPKRGCDPRQGKKGFPIKPSPIFYSNLN
jgi:hypothetical protein